MKEENSPLFSVILLSPQIGCLCDIANENPFIEVNI